MQGKPNSKMRTMKKRMIIVMLVFLTLQSCEHFNPNALKEPLDYKADQIGWEITVNKGWEILGEEDIAYYDEQGKEAIEDALDMEVDYGSLINLLHFQKDEMNSFISTIEPFEETYPGEWLETIEYIKELMLFTYENEGMSATAGSTSTEEIDGLEFQTYKIEITTDGGVFIMGQIIYGSFVAGYDFGTAISYSNEDDKNEMLEMWRNSTFDKSEFDSDYDLEYDEEIEAQYEKIINKADSLYDLGRYDKASELYERATSIKPEEEYPFDILEEIESL